MVGGSGGSRFALAFRGSVDAVVAALTRTEEGLTQLALAANAFRPARLARDARLPSVDMTSADRIARDGLGFALPVTQKQIAQLAAAADSEHEDGEGDRSGSGSDEPTPEGLLQRLAAALPSSSSAVRKQFEDVLSRQETLRAPTALSSEDRRAILENLQAATTTMFSIA